MRDYSKYLDSFFSGLDSVISRLLNLCLLVSTCVLYGQKPGLGRAVAALVPFAALTTFLLRDYYLKNKPKASAHDRELFSEFMAQLPYNVMLFYQKQDMAGSLDADDFHPGYRFHRQWEDAAHQFHDEEIEHLKEELRTMIGELGDEYWLHTTADRTNRAKLPKSHKSYWDRQDMDFYEKRNELNDLATAIFEKHQEIVRKGTRRFVE